MSRSCTICEHTKRAEIEDAIARGIPYRRIAPRYGLSIAALSRHLRTHVGEELLDLFEKRRDGRSFTQDPSPLAAELGELGAGDLGRELGPFLADEGEI